MPPPPPTPPPPTPPPPAASPPPPASPPDRPPSPFLGRPARRLRGTTGRRLGPNRRHSRLTHLVRVEIHVRRDALLAELAGLDAELRTRTARRTAILDELDVMRERLWPIEPRQRGRRPPAHDESPLSPMAVDARPLWGSELRSFALAVLAHHGPTRLRDLHDLIHRYGYCIDSRTPVKALADALGYEADAGRAVRVRRGVYRSTTFGPPPRRAATGPAPAPLAPGADHVEPVTATMSDARAEAILDAMRAAHERRSPAPDPGKADHPAPAEPAPLGPPDPAIVHDPRDAPRELAPRSPSVPPAPPPAQPSLRTVASVITEMHARPTPKEGIP